MLNLDPNRISPFDLSAIFSRHTHGKWHFRKVYYLFLSTLQKMPILQECWWLKFWKKGQFFVFCEVYLLHKRLSKKYITPCMPWPRLIDRQDFTNCFFFKWSFICMQRGLLTSFWYFIFDVFSCECIRVKVRDKKLVLYCKFRLLSSKELISIENEKLWHSFPI